jgi:hypothetical protein
VPPCPALRKAPNADALRCFQVLARIRGNGYRRGVRGFRVIQFLRDEAVFDFRRAVAAIQYMGIGAREALRPRKGRVVPLRLAGR